ncbi:ROK family transcriptional regulator [Streptomyces sp. ISL-22]|uniref:ROK family transcriptional regulator n=1 Tax=unclassified Streptomyces TaxID=2593676 RepID=UPI001BEAD6D6|nr:MULTISPECIES: ROK family transcriptional regulator [unclassified Streptomyces]MBT2419846.1 ROK family transcriptional regulator [Streptomyces sp. ISL-24]MBT2435189.1 ROK family transcriptional regulator [Streptomyces sp. ISL-22]
MPASPSTARAINDRLALRLLQQEGPLTAGQLKQLTGLSRPTVADLVERLTAAGLIAVVGEAGEQRRGPNAKLYGIVADRAHLAALDVRTEGVSVVVSDLVGAVLAEASVPIGGDTGTGPAVEQAVALVERVVKEAGADRLHTVGIGAPGLIDPATGELRDSTGLPEWHRRLVAALQERLPEARVNVENETNLAALAEQRDGVARDRDTFVLLWLGHGTGAAVVLDGALRRGASGGTGEIGFLPVPGTSGLPSAVDCAGGFHSLAGAAAIVELAGAYGLTVEGGAAHEPPAAGVVRDAVALVARSDGEGAGKDQDDLDTASAARFLDALADRIAIGVASVVAVLDPGCVVLGGEVGQAGGEALAGRVEERVRRMAPPATVVRPSSLGGEAVLRGALLTARDAAQDELFAPRDR